MSIMAPSVELTSATMSADRVQFETLLSDISARLIAATSDQLEQVILSALHAVRVFFGADRCALCNVSDDRQKVHFAHIVCGEGVSNILGDLDLAVLFPWLRKRIVVDGEYLAMSRLSDLPPEAARDRATFEARGTRSLLCVPIEAGSRRLRLILLSVVCEELEWPEEYVPRLRLLGEMLVNRIEGIRAWNRAREEAARVAAAVEAAGLGFAEWKLGTDEAYMDSRFRDLLGLSAEEQFEKATALWIARAQADIKATLSENCCQAQAGEVERARLEYQYDHPRRGLIWLRHSLRRLDGERGECGRVIVALEDVTERRQALEDVQRLREELKHENAYLRQEAKRRLGPGPGGIVGRGAAIRRALASAEQVAATDSTVLLLGETGSGKERFASYIHECSRRRERLMVRVNCSAIPTTLMESELFGREKGAYTGALSKQIGRFELAHGSTLFLDEIAELPLDMQVKLLRVLENHSIERLGNPKPVPVDVRIIAATNRDLLAAVREGRFRGDLYYRLNVFPISVPALRERREDIPLFVQAFVDELAGPMGKRIEEIDSASLDNLLVYPWPGNVRELRNAVERAMILTTGPRLRISTPELDHLAASMTGQTHVERTHILQVLRDAGWRIRGQHGAAERLGLKPTTLESRIKKLGLIRPSKVA